VTHIDTERPRSRAAFYQIFDRIDRITHELETLRVALAVEVGFERVHPRDLKPDDGIRTHNGHWYKVVRSYRATDEFGPSVWVIDHSGGRMTVRDESEDFPFPPLVDRAYDVDETIF
jgi:hypothetical protein